MYKQAGIDEVRKVGTYQTDLIILYSYSLVKVDSKRFLLMVHMSS
jgi:hypothetical protein